MSVMRFPKLTMHLIPLLVSCGFVSVVADSPTKPRIVRLPKPQQVVLDNGNAAEINRSIDRESSFQPQKTPFVSSRSPAIFEEQQRAVRSAMPSQRFIPRLQNLSDVQAAPIQSKASRSRERRPSLSLVHQETKLDAPSYLTAVEPTGSDTQDNVSAVENLHRPPMSQLNTSQPGNRFTGVNSSSTASPSDFRRLTDLQHESMAMPLGKPPELSKISPPVGQSTPEGDALPTRGIAAGPQQSPAAKVAALSLIDNVNKRVDSVTGNGDTSDEVANPVDLQVNPSRGHAVRWWEANVTGALRNTPRQLRISLDALLIGALSNSAQVRMLSDEPLITETEITTADAAFDWTSFVDARWDDVSEPVGSTLTTGGPERLRDHNANVEFGMRRRNTVGGEFEIGQRLGFQNSNSIFFLPQDQGSSRLTLSYTQPLLRGAGRVYNTSLTVLAQLRTKQSRNEFESQLQDHLLSVTREYWTLYFERARYLQNQRLLKNGLRVLEEIESRKDVDALRSQVVRARAAVANRQSQLIQSRLTIRMAEARLRALVNDSALGNTMQVELIPKGQLRDHRYPVELEGAISTALRNRPEVEAAIQQVKSASVRMNMSKQEALPMLNVVLESYATGLEGNSRVARAIREQFTEGEPSYGVGLQYEYPIWNRAAGSRVQKRRLELRRLQHQFQQTIETMKLEVELSVHQIDAAFESIGARRHAMVAAAEEVAYLFDRWQLLPVDNGSASLLLEDLLEAQDRLSDSERAMLQALLDHNLSQVEFKRSVGTLLAQHEVTIDRNCQCRLPQQELHGAPATEPHPFQGQAIPAASPPQSDGVSPQRTPVSQQPINTINDRWDSSPGQRLPGPRPSFQRTTEILETPAAHRVSP